MKISEIIINNYRAFYNENDEEDKYRVSLKGKNLLVYGENGSGKSSLYKGLKDFFVSSTDPTHIVIQNVFSKVIDLKIQPFVSVTFVEANNPPASYIFSSDPAITNTDQALLKSVVKSRSFMTYRDLLRIHFINSNDTNLFEFLFGEEGLLSEIENPSSTQPETKLKLHELWKIVESKPDTVNITDFCNGVNQTLSETNIILNQLLAYFDKSLSINFSTLTHEMVSDHSPFIKVNVKYFGIDLNAETEQYNLFLNEARLSALAICVFLSAHLSIPLPSYKILFLDDIFTGLDTSNRIPLLDILTDNPIKGTAGETFDGHQIILTTYDRHWYELAKNHLNRAKWNFEEFYIDRNEKGFDLPRLLPGKDDLERAYFFFEMKQYPACANYQRKVCEGLIKRFLPDSKKYDVEPGGGISPTTKLDVLISRLEQYLNENDMDFSPFENLRNCVRVVMNPMSHDDFESQFYRRELEMVFQIISQLQKLKNSTVLEAGKKIVFKKAHRDTGVMRESICEVLFPVRKLEFDDAIHLTNFLVFLLSEKDGEGAVRKISYKGPLHKIYDSMCHDLKIETDQNLYINFSLSDGTPLSEILS